MLKGILMEVRMLRTPRFVQVSPAANRTLEPCFALAHGVKHRTITMGGAKSKAAAAEDPEQKRRRNEGYQAMLARAEGDFIRRVAANDCPKEKLDNFKILGSLGNGGFGSVYFVEHRTTRAQYALKAIPKERFTHRYHRDMVVYEKKATYALQHPFIVTLVFAFQDWKNLYLVMERATHGDLFRLIGREQPEKTVKYIAAQLILGIEYIHACKVVHRDLKLTNIFIGKDYYLMIGDFGFAKKIGEKTFTICGTVSYQAPEIINQQGYGRGVDWWALGIILYRLFYMNNPFGDDDWDDRRMADAILHTTLRFPNVDENLPRNTFIKGLLQKSYKERFGCTDALMDQMKEHEWFEDVSFNDVYDKRITLDPTIGAVQPKAKAMYSFMPIGESGEASRFSFDEF